MFRIIIAIMIGGGFLSFKGYQEFQVSSNTNSTATKVKVEDLEKGKKLTNNYVQLDEHIALIGGCVYSVSLAKHQTKPTNSSTVEYIYYPVISNNNPYFVKQDELIAKFGSYEAIPQKMLPRLTNIKILVKTEKYKTFGSIPEEVDHKDKFKGLVVNSINSLDSEERSLIKQSFPGVDLKKVFVIEEGRTPSSSFLSLLMMAGGVIIILGAGGFGLKSMKG